MAEYMGDRIGEGTTFFDRVAQKVLDPNRNGRLDAAEIMTAARYYGERVVTVAKADSGSRSAQRSVEDFERQITPATVKRELLKIKAEADKAYVHGMEMPTDAQINELVVYGKDVARRAKAYSHRGGDMDKLQGAVGMFLETARENGHLASVALETLREDLRLPSVPFKPAQAAKRTPGD